MTLDERTRKEEEEAGAEKKAAMLWLRSACVPRAGGALSAGGLISV